NNAVRYQIPLDPTRANCDEGHYQAHHTGPGFGHPGISPEGPLLSEQPLSLSSDDAGWFDQSVSSKTAPASAFPVPATLHQSDASGFDQLSPFDEVCASAFNTPFTPYLDTPDQTPHETPLFDCVASEDFDTTICLEQFWNDTVAPAVAVQNSSVNLDLSPSTLASTSLAAQDAAQNPFQINGHLQAENALLDFVLFDDIAAPSPISTFSTLSTPMTTSLASPPSADPKEIENHELAMQLVAIAAASLSSQSSPFSNDSSDVIENLFSDVDLSPLESATSIPVSSSPEINMPNLDWTSTTSVSQNFSFDFSAHCSAANNTATPIVNGCGLQSSPMLPVNVASPEVDLGLLLGLDSYQQQQQQTMFAPMFASMPNASEQQQQQQTPQTPKMHNPLKRKSDEADKQSSGESPRQFACGQCGRAFSRLFNLNTHERTHDRSKARLFACPQQGCKKSFTRKNDLQRHQISIHGVTDIYSCLKCNKPFSRRDTLRRHMALENCEDDKDPQDHSHPN
ncbi:hypothetical protein BGZ50_006238, partial [Haplosporangium sp. Z 11]